LQAGQDDVMTAANRSLRDGEILNGDNNARTQNSDLICPAHHHRFDALLDERPACIGYAPYEYRALASEADRA
jgi:hypothetical protein